MSSEEISSSPNAKDIIAEKRDRKEEVDSKRSDDVPNDSCVSGQCSKSESSTNLPKTNDSQRCNKCRKKVGLFGMDCRCGNVYCAIHRYSNEHDCTFDYRSMGAEEIRKNNPQIVADKVTKI